MADLKTALIRRITSGGPMSIAEYMHTCLLHPTMGYYTTRDPFGARGDFITAPEISQMFGEMIGLCLAQAWMDQGAPRDFVLAELGPGRGTLMADILRATAKVAGFHDAARIILVEAAPNLIARQRQTLAQYQVRWVPEVADIPAGPLFLVANEFFDALPIRQFERGGDAWRERVITVEGDNLTFGLGAATPFAALEHRLIDTKDGDLVETCAPANSIARSIGERIETHGGAAILIDYGDWRSLGDTFQALSHHGYADPLADAGNADLTAHVDFEALVSRIPCRHTRLTTQGVFLERLGITSRAESLAKGDAQTAQSVIDAHRRLTHPDEMGSLFKVIGLYPQSGPAPAGLEP